MPMKYINQNKIIVLRLFVVGLCFSVMLGFFAPVAQANKVDLQSSKASLSTINLTLGKADIFPLKGNVADVLVADPSVADVVAIQSDKLYVVGSRLGDTNIIVLDEDGGVLSKIDVHVKIDTDSIESMVHALFPDEKDVKVYATNGQVYLTGKVSTPNNAQKISRMVAAHVVEVSGDGGVGDVDEVIENLLKVDGEMQVTLRVRIMEVSRDIIRELGLETYANDVNEGALPLISSTAPASLANLSGQVSSITQLTQDPAGVGRVLFDTGISGIGFLELAVRALEQENLLNVLAEPNLTAISGEQAGFLAGGEFPVPIGRDRDGNITIEFREFGVSLNFLPVVLSSDRISLQLDTEVSSLDFGQGITLAELSIPGLNVRRASTTVELPSGGSMMIAGLLRSEASKGLSGLPGVKDTPILGDLISSRSFQRQETEMVVMVTPFIVKPFADTPQVEKKIDVVSKSPLSGAFASNLKRTYGSNIHHLPSEDSRYGYILN